MPPEAAGDYEGVISAIDRSGVVGWVKRLDSESSVWVTIRINDSREIRVIANALNAGLEEAGYGFGRFGFQVSWEELSRFEDHVITVQTSDATFDIPGSPFVIRQADRIDDIDLDQLYRLIVDSPSLQVFQAMSARLAALVTQLQQRYFDELNGKPSITTEQRFQDRWHAVKGGRRATSSKTVLLIDGNAPQTGRNDRPLDAAASQVRALQRLGYQVALCCIDDRAPDRQACERLRIECWARPWVATVEEVLLHNAGFFGHVMLRHVKDIAYYPLIRRYFPKGKIIFSSAGLHWVREHRRIVVDELKNLEPYLLHSRNREMQVIAASDIFLTESRADFELVRRMLPTANAHLLPREVPGGNPATAFAKRAGVALAGNFADDADAAALYWFVTEIVPAVIALEQTASFLIVGPNVPDYARSLHPQHIRILGEAEELDAVLDAARLSVCPMLYGSGVKDAVIASLSAGVPCVCTTVAAEGLDLPPDLRASMVADGTAAFAQRIAALYADQDANEACSGLGLAFCSSIRTDDIDRLLESALGTAAR